MRKSSFLFFYLLLVFQVAFAQQKESIEIKLEDNSISISVDGDERLIKGIVQFQKVNFAVANATLSKRGKEANVRFVTKDKKAVDVSMVLNGNVITFSLSPNKNNSANGHNYSGLFFDVPDFKIGTSIWRYGESKAWTKPVPVKDLSKIDSANVQFFYWQYQDGLYGVAMPLGGNGYSSSIGQHNGLFGSRAVTLVNNHFADDIPLLAVAFGTNIYEVIDQVVERGMIAMGYPENLRKKKTYPSVFENFGWCTWDAFGHKVNEQKVIEGVESFTKNNFPVPFVLIDDGWLRVGENMKLKSFVPDSVKFSSGFRPLVNKLRKDYGVNDVGIWHTINAYWKGVDTSSVLGKKYKDILLPYQGKMPWSKDTLKTFYTPSPKTDKSITFFNDWYSSLSSEGISFIKVDNQLVVGQIADNNYPLWNTGKQLQQNFQLPAKKYFNGYVINCMEMTVDDIYHFGSSAIARASDDYMPKEISYNLESGNAAVHIVNCLYNSLWLSPIVWPDYDMFESYQLYPEYHAIARAISGGPVYVSDWPGEQNFEVLRPLISKEGKIYRTDIPAQLTEDCLFQVQDAKPLKAFSFVGKSGLLGVWNASNSGFVSGSFKPSDIQGIEGSRFAIYEFFSKKLIQAQKEEPIPLELTRMDYRLFTVAPIESGVAVFGLVNKYNSPKTIMSQEVFQDRVEVTVTESGEIAMYLDKAPQGIRLNSSSTENYSYRDGLLQIKLNETSGPVKVTVLR
jgi:hypothetical protein